MKPYLLLSMACSRNQYDLTNLGRVFSHYISVLFIMSPSSIFNTSYDFVDSALYYLVSVFFMEHSWLECSDDVSSWLCSSLRNIDTTQENC